MLESGVGNLRILVVVDVALDLVVGALGELDLAARAVDCWEAAGFALVFVQESCWPVNF